MELNDTQKKALTAWVAEGASISEIQRKLTSEYSLSVTYMDLRLALIDLGLAIKEKAVKPAAPAAPAAVPAPPPPPPAAAAGPAKKEKGRGLFNPFAKEPEAPAGGSLSLEVDRIMRPGSLVSGSVTFSDGVRATWMLDQMGRLALDAGRPGYRPSDTDVQAFQEALTRELEKQGF
jgi:hypothetical protein